MTTYLDGDRFRARLEEMQESLVQSARERHEADGENDPTALRMDGGVANLHLLLTQLHHYEVTPGQQRKTPIKDMRPSAKAKVRRYDPGTSFSAALLQTPEKSRGLYTAIRQILERKPMTDEELLALFQSRGKSVTPSGVRSRRAELVDAGWLRDSGEKRPTAAGNPSIVWEATPVVA